MKIAVQGCCHGDLHKIYKSLNAMEAAKNIKVDLLIICGDFQAIRDENDMNCMACPIKYRHMGDFKDYYDGTSVAPVLTIFIGGNHEASNHLQELYYGGWVCPNIYYLGHSGVVNFGGLRIAGISGIFYPHDYKTGYYEKFPFSYEMIRSAYHYREFEIKKLMKIKNTVDIFLSHEWPAEIYNYGNVDELIRKKPYFKNEIETNKLGAKPLKILMDALKPKNWFSAHLHVGFDAIKMFTDGSSTKFMALDKCLPNRDYLRIIDIPRPQNETKLLRLEYDTEWLSILKESEQFMNYTRGPWIISADFYKIDDKIRSKITEKLSNEKKIIICQKNFFQGENNQKKYFKKNYILSNQNTKNENCAAELNPEEIELDL